MTSYTKTTNFALKDGLATGTGAKAVSGSILDTEFNNIQTHSATKIDNPATKSANQYLQYNGTDWIATTALGTPVGTIVAYGGITEPTDWLFCDGRSLLVANYGDLHTAIGYGFGGSGANFNLPDLRGRAAIGLDNMATAAGAASRLGSETYTHPNGGGNEDTIGSYSGAERHQLTVAQMPSHDHNAAGSWDLIAAGGVTLINPGTNTAIDGRITSHTPTTISAAGSDTPHNNMPPLQLINYMIRYM